MPKEVPMDLADGQDQAGQDQGIAGAKQQVLTQNNPPPAQDQGAQGLPPPGTPVIPVPRSQHQGGLVQGQQPPTTVLTTPPQPPAQVDGTDEQ